MTVQAQNFRPGPGAGAINENRLVRVEQRPAGSGAWKVPHGGLGPSVEPSDGCLRELGEELGISREDVVLIDAYPTPLAYELPPSMRSPKTGRGQTQHWFLFMFHGRDTSIDISGS